MVTTMAVAAEVTLAFDVLLNSNDGNNYAYSSVNMLLASKIEAHRLQNNCHPICRKGIEWFE